ncbi:hypothetical protein BKA70DRAFT_1303033 [Coprinopsis sp. MPI-PUGE-AT-0042]|nr:hypothetical protein BKA70DRAFT_1303033 [Coprinopsis sp. MPI-PUGE-AT-0042]
MPNLHPLASPTPPICEMVPARRPAQPIPIAFSAHHPSSVRLRSTIVGSASSNGRCMCSSCILTDIRQRFLRPLAVSFRPSLTVINVKDGMEGRTRATRTIVLDNVNSTVLSYGYTFTCEDHRHFDSLVQGLAPMRIRRISQSRGVFCKVSERSRPCYPVLPRRRLLHIPIDDDDDLALLVRPKQTGISFEVVACPSRHREVRLGS